MEKRCGHIFISGPYEGKRCSHFITDGDYCSSCLYYDSKAQKDQMTFFHLGIEDVSIRPYTIIEGVRLFLIHPSDIVITKIENDVVAIGSLKNTSIVPLDEEDAAWCEVLRITPFMARSYQNEATIGIAL